MAEVLSPEPPSYDGFGLEALVRSSNGASDLPAYTRRPTPPPVAAAPEPREFTYHLKNRSGVAWGSITVQGNPRLTKLYPTIMEGSNIAGTVQLRLQKPEGMQAVCVILKGELIGGAPASLPQSFLETRTVLWNASEGDPNAPGSPATGSKINGLKLKGDYNWSFSIAIPQEITRDGETWRTPHSFADSTCSIRYSVDLRVVRGKLRPDDKISCPFAYFSMRQPERPSPLRMLAYQENSPLLGPEVDPEGWASYPVTLKAILFASRAVEVKMTFFVAKPLCYTRSASIPCALTLESNDSQALDLVSVPSALIVCLERTTREGEEGYRTTIEPCGQGVFWPSPMSRNTPDAPASKLRELMGEIHLKADLQPSSAVLGFAIEYAVVVFPLQAVGFKPNEDSKPILRVPVEITTRYGPGPRQKTYSPPAYEGRNIVVEQYYFQLVMLRSTMGNRKAGTRPGR
uniref:Arrestin-like N-terminal domain-containing protein n=1 Tax=Mycena chlorophos TaxID=658473 RepID=A0ABQ0LXR3_MYCCL|nr:predicted protein [Mycena chlorophos]